MAPLKYLSLVNIFDPMTGRFLILITVSVLGASCASSFKVKQQMATTVVSYPDTTMLSSTGVEVTDTIVLIADLADKAGGGGIDVKYLKGYFVPLLAYYGWGGEYDILMSHAQLKGDGRSFVAAEISSQLRNSLYVLADTLGTTRHSPDGLILEVKVDQWNVNGVYKAKGSATYMFIMYLIYVQHVTSGVAQCQLSYRLRKGDAILVENTVKSSVNVLPLVGKFKDGKQARATCVRNYSEALVRAFNMVTFNMVSELGEFVSQ